MREFGFTAEHIVETKEGSFDPASLDAPTEALVTVMKKHQRYFPIYGVDGKLLATASADNTVRVWEVTAADGTARPQLPPELTAACTGVVRSAEGTAVQMAEMARQIVAGRRAEDKLR